MADIILKRNAGFMGTGGKLLRVLGPDPVKFGSLYNWYAVTDTKNLAASGWSVPSISQWNTLSSYLGNYWQIGHKLKEIGTTYWVSPNTGATNEVGFNGRAQGYRNEYGFGDLLTVAFYWSSTSYDSTHPWMIGLSAGSEWFYQDNIYINQYGMAVRLIKDSTSLTHGQKGTYTGNDGKLYRTICIGTQEWLADNLYETKFRDNSWIPGYDNGVYTSISNSTWRYLTSSGMCAYESNINNF